MRFECPECGSGLRYDPAAEALRCPACSFTEALPENEPAPLHEYASWESQAREAAFGERTLEAQCPSCGARVEFEPPLASARCAFCTSELIGQPHTADPLLTPDAVLPFTVTLEGVRRILTGVENGKFAVKITEVRAVYVPFWVFTAKAAAEWTRTPPGNPAVSGRHEEEYWDIGVAAVKAIPADAMRMVGEFPWAEAVLYHPGYLAGHEALRYQSELPEGLAELRENLGRRMKNRVEQSTPGPGPYTRYEVALDRVRFQHVLAPVWIGAYKHRGKVYQFVVNGATGAYAAQGLDGYGLVLGCLAVFAALFVAAWFAMDAIN